MRRSGSSARSRPRTISFDRIGSDGCQPSDPRQERQPLASARSQAAVGVANEKARPPDELEEQGGTRKPRGVGVAAVRRWADAEIHRCLRQPQEALRGASAGPLQDRSDRPPPESAIGGGRPDRGDPDAGAEAAGAAAQDRGRPVEHRAHSGRVAAAARKIERVGRPRMMTKKKPEHDRGV